MSDSTAVPCLLRASEIAALTEQRFQHPFNPHAVRMTRALGDLTGLTAMGIHLVRVEPGHETTVYHTHACSDEFLYILTGRGIAVIGDVETNIGPGDFMGFPQGGPAHTMRNPYDEDLIYLVGGTRPDVDVVTYPQLGRKVYKVAGVSEFVEIMDIHEMG